MMSRSRSQGAEVTIVTGAFPYELSFLSVFWITSNSNHKYMFDVVKKVFNRSGRNKNTAQRHQAFELVYSRSHMTLYRVLEHSYYRKSKE